jgi:hypothetical protein
MERQDDLIAFAGGQPTRVATTLLCAGALVHIVGEMMGSGGQWGVQMGLAPRERRGQYQGFAGMGLLVVWHARPHVHHSAVYRMGPAWLVRSGWRD